MRTRSVTRKKPRTRSVSALKKVSKDPRVSSAKKVSKMATSKPKRLTVDTVVKEYYGSKRKHNAMQASMKWMGEHKKKIGRAILKTAGIAGAVGLAGVGVAAVYGPAVGEGLATLGTMARSIFTGSETLVAIPEIETIAAGGADVADATVAKVEGAVGRGTDRLAEAINATAPEPPGRYMGSIAENVKVAPRARAPVNRLGFGSSTPRFGGN